MASTQLKVLSVVPLSVIPPPSAPTSLGEDTEPSSRFLSPYETIVVLIFVVVPFTVRSPAIVTLLEKVVLPDTDINPEIVVLPPTLNCFARPRPPETIKAPVVVVVESVVLLRVIALAVDAPRPVTVESVLVSRIRIASFVASTSILISIPLTRVSVSINPSATALPVSAHV